MKIARYWEMASATAQWPSGKNVPVIGWGWSENSRDEARAMARLHAEKNARRVETRSFGRRQGGDDYYHDKPPREEILREIHDTRGEVVALVTRNSQGAQILNTRSLMFIDIDVPRESRSALARFFSGLLRRESKDATTQIRRRVEQIAAQQSEYSFRLYRTAGGFRCALISQPMDATSTRSNQLLEIFGADMLYRKLCGAQECYRARLTPKFWRIGARRPPLRFPYLTVDDAETHRAWQRDYEERCAPYATCHFEKQIGEKRADAALQETIALHDRMTGALSDAKLA